MKIIHVTPYYSPHVGGMETCVEMLAHIQQELGHEVKIYTSKLGGEQKYKHDNVCRVWAWDKKINSPLSPSLPFRLLSEAGSGIYHIHLGPFFYPEIGMMISRLKGSPSVVHVHLSSQSNLLFMKHVLEIYKALLFKIAKRCISHFIVPTQAYKQLLQKYKIKNEDISVVPYGVDKSFINIGTERKYYSLKNEPIKLLTVARLYHQKGIDRALHTLRFLKDKKINVTYTVVGDGPEKNDLKRMSKELGVAESVEFVGAVPSPDIGEYYKNADIFFLPSRFESFGIVLIEAAACGLPVVASDIPTIRNVASEFALLVKPGAENFGKGVMDLIDNERLVEELVKKGKEEALRYDWSKITKRIIEIYENCK
jgi:glycosyltransferase involved in cell wall biosynthesis